MSLKMLNNGETNTGNSMNDSDRVGLCLLESSRIVNGEEEANEEYTDYNVEFRLSVCIYSFVHFASFLTFANNIAINMTLDTSR